MSFTTKPLSTIGLNSGQDGSMHKQAAAENMALSMIEKLFHPCVIVLQDIYMHVKFISGNSVHLFGYTTDELKNKVFRTFAACLHEEDKEPFLRARQKMDELTRSIHPYEITEYRFVMNYRFRRADGKYIHMQEERITMADHTGGYMYFFVFKDISAEKPFVRIHVEWLKYKNGVYQKINSYVPITSETHFSQRETEVLQLIKEGFSSKEIAEILCISINTVRNHRSNLFKKAHARNMVELLNYAEAV
jgi:PAS domain S-box-containing protein